jgi:general secretion pathway protein L
MLFIRLHSFEPGDLEAAYASWVTLKDGKARGPSQRGAVKDIPDPGTDRVVVCVPATDMLIAPVSLPAGNRQRMLKAVPYALEEQIVDDVEELHFALSSADVDGRFRVAALDRIRISDWLEVLSSAGISPYAMVPDLHCLPYEAGTWGVLIDGSTAMVRTTTFDGYALEVRNLPIMLEGALREAGEEKPKTIRMYLAGESHALKSIMGSSDEGVEFSFSDYGGDATRFLAKNYDPQTSLNLLQGEYSREEQWGKYLRPWYPVAALFLIWLVVQTGVDIYRYQGFSSQVEQLEKQISVVYKQAFPDSRNVRVGTERARMDSELKSLRARSGKGQVGLPEMLTKAGPVLSRTRDLEIQSIRFRDGRLELKVEAKDLASLDKVKEGLAAQSGWKVESQSTSRGNRVESQIRVQASGA